VETLQIRKVIEQHLDSLKLEYKHDPERRLFYVNIIGKDRKKLPIMVSYSKNWVKVFIYLMNEKKVPEYVDRAIFYRLLLEENFYTSGATYSMTENGSILAEKEIDTMSALDLRIFRNCIRAVLYAARYFYKEILKI